LELRRVLFRSALLGELGRGRTDDPAFRRFAMALMLATSFGASIGGIGTPVGTPPNLIGIGLLRDLAGIDIAFTSWMAFGVPVVAVVMAVLLVVLLAPLARAITVNREAIALVDRELRALGHLSAAERNVIAAFGLTILLWMLPGLLQIVLGTGHASVRWMNAHVPEAVAALVGAMLLF